MHKRIPVVLMASLLALAMCLPAAAESLTEKYAPQDGKHYTIDLLSMQANPVDNSAPLVQYWNERFNVTLNVVNIANAEALNVQIAAGDAPDTLYISGNANFLKLARDGVLAEMDEEVVKAYAPDYYNNLTAYLPSFFEDNMTDGAIYGFNTVNYWAAYHQPIVWNGQWLAAVGLDRAPETFEEFDRALRAFAHDDPDGNGQKDTFGLSRTGMQTVYSAFGTSVPDTGIFWQELDGQLLPTLISENARKALAYLAELYADGVVSPEFVTGENTGGYWALSQAFINGQIGLSGLGSHYHWGPGDPDRDWGGASANWKAVHDINPDMALAITYGQPIPTAEGARLHPAQGVTYGFGYYAFNADVAEREPDKIGKMLQIFNEIGSVDAKTLSTAIYGFEGEHWDYTTAFGQQVPARNADRTATDDILLGGNTLMFFAVSPQVYREAYPENFIAAKLTGVDQYVLDNAISMPLSALNEYGDECNTLKNEFYFGVIRGERSIDAFDAFVAEWLNIGGQAIWDEALAAYGQ